MYLEGTLLFHACYASVIYTYYVKVHVWVVWLCVLQGVWLCLDSCGTLANVWVSIVVSE